MLHPDHLGVVVAQGRMGRSWTRNKAGSAVDECREGEQMVLVTRIVLSGVPIMNVDDLNDITALDEAVISPASRGTLLKWSSAHLVEILKDE